MFAVKVSTAPLCQQAVYSRKRKFLFRAHSAGLQAICICRGYLFRHSAAGDYHRFHCYYFLICLKEVPTCEPIQAVDNPIRRGCGSREWRSRWQRKRWRRRVRHRRRSGPICSAVALITDSQFPHFSLSSSAPRLNVLLVDASWFSTCHPDTNSFVVSKILNMSKRHSMPFVRFDNKNKTY